MLADVDIRLVIGRLQPGAMYQWVGTKGDTGYGSLAECIGEWRWQEAMPSEAEMLAEWDVYLTEQEAADAAGADLDAVAPDEAAAMLDDINEDMALVQEQGDLDLLVLAEIVERVMLRQAAMLLALAEVRNRLTPG